MDQCFVDPGLSGKVVVSVADAGETAVVVSMLEGKQETKKQIQNMSSLEICEKKAPFQMSDSVTDAGRKSATGAVEKIEEQESKKVYTSSNIPEDVKMHASLPISFVNKQKLESPSRNRLSVGPNLVGKIEEQETTKVYTGSNIPEDVKMYASLPNSFVNKQKLKTPSKNRLSVGPNSVTEELRLDLTQESSDILPSNSESAFGDKGMIALSIGSETSTSKLLDQHCSKATLESGINPYVGLSVSTYLSVKKLLQYSQCLFN